MFSFKWEHDVIMYKWMYQALLRRGESEKCKKLPENFQSRQKYKSCSSWVSEKDKNLKWNQPKNSTTTCAEKKLIVQYTEIQRDWEGQNSGSKLIQHA